MTTARTHTTCAQCGKPITPRTSDVKRGWGRYCSKSCKAKHAHATGAHRKNGVSSHDGA